MSPRPDDLIARDPCVLQSGWFGRRGQLALYGDRLVFSTGGGTESWDIALERIERLALRGRRRRVLAVGFDGGESAFRLEPAAARMRDLCALLVQLHPALPWLDSRFGAVDPVAAAALLASHGLSLAHGETFDLCEGCLAWTNDDEARCGSLLLTNRRVLFLHAGSGPGRPPPRVHMFGHVERADPLAAPGDSLWLTTGRELLRFDPCSGAEFVQAFWKLFEAPGRGSDQDILSRSQALGRLAGQAQQSRFTLATGVEVGMRDLTWVAEGSALVALVPHGAVQPLRAGETCAVEMVHRSGLLQFEGWIAAVEPVAEGPFKARQARLWVQPISDIVFINRRRAFRVETALAVRVDVERARADGGHEPATAVPFRLADLSSIGCALVGPAGIPETSRFAFDLPIGEAPGRLRLRAECVHVRPSPDSPITRVYGMRLAALTEAQREAVQREVVRQERAQIRRRAELRDRS